jgi:hypothetical protein
LGLRLATSMIFVLTLLACAQGNCRRETTEIPPYPGQKEILEGKTPVLSAEEKAKRAFVFKYDGSKQCGLGEAVTVEAMEKELAGIKILSKDKKNDGMMYIQKCGSGTGQANVYEIYKVDLEKALARSFKEWKN